MDRSNFLDTKLRYMYKVEWFARLHWHKFNASTYLGTKSRVPLLQANITFLLQEQELVFIQEPEVESANEEQDIPENPISTGVYTTKEMKSIVIKNPRKRNSYNDSIMIGISFSLNLSIYYYVQSVT